MKIISFDPASFRNLGWAIADIQSEFSCAAGTFVINNNSDPWKSLYPFQSLIRLFIKEQEPDFVIIEKTSDFHGGFVTGQISNCIGVILSSCGEFNLDVHFLYPTHVKKIVTGKGKVTKKFLKTKVNEHLTNWNISPMKFDSEHACDALANIICYLLEDPNSPLKEENL